MNRESVGMEPAQPMAFSRRKRAHGAAALGLEASDGIAEAEAYELSTAQPDTEIPSFTTMPTFAHAGFDSLTPGEYSWMIPSIFMVFALTALGVYVSFWM